MTAGEKRQVFANSDTVIYLSIGKHEGGNATRAELRDWLIGLVYDAVQLDLSWVDAPKIAILPASARGI